jgi:hypothetical protein
MGAGVTLRFLTLIGAILGEGANVVGEIGARVSKLLVISATSVPIECGKWITSGILANELDRFSRGEARPTKISAKSKLRLAG